MLVNINELKKYVDLNGLSANDIAEGLTFAGIEVEEVTKLASGTNLVIGHILECENHPDSDHLHVLKVDLGSEVKQIVCGAPNARKGLKVIVAQVGAKLPGGEIKPSVIRGVESNGMCCSLLELGVDSKFLNEKQTSGIEELPEDAPVGETNVLGYLGLDDEVLNLKILANRPDLLSLYNVAKEVGAIFSRKVEIPTHEVKGDFVTDLKVGSETNRCSRFSGREIKNIVIKDSPKFMKEALTAMGVRSISNIVDIGNYVMLLTGQPLHMYDKDKLEKHELIAKDNLGVKFVALDEKTYDVIPGDIVITSNNKAMCLGGVMGSLECAVDEKTKNIYIEAASFDGASIRHTSLRLGLSSESSSRFVKGTNPFQTEDVINFASYLIKEYCGGQQFSNIVTYDCNKKQTRVIDCSTKRINNRLGTEFSKNQMVEVLTKLHFEIKNVSDDEFKVIVPDFRLDVFGEADISEEVIRILGFDNVKSVLPTLDVRVGGLSTRQFRLRKIREALCDMGLDECLTYSLLSKENSEKFNLLNDEEHYTLLNPLTDEREVFRTHILYSLLEAASYNFNRQNKDLSLFETSNMVSKFSRSEHLAVVLVGNELNRDLMNKTPYDFFHMKGIVENIFALLGIEASRYRFDRYESDKEELHPGKSAKIIFQNQCIGVLGELHPNALKTVGLKGNVIALEMNIDPLLDGKVSIAKMSPISKFPSVSRDLALIISKDVAASDIVKVVKKNGNGLVKDAKIFDVYEGENIFNGYKSVAISISLSKEGTLTDKEINDTLDKIKFELGKAYNAQLRM